MMMLQEEHFYKEGMLAAGLFLEMRIVAQYLLFISEKEVKRY